MPGPAHGVPPPTPRGCGFPTRGTGTRSLSLGPSWGPTLPPYERNSRPFPPTVITQKGASAKRTQAIHLQSPGVLLAFNTFFFLIKKKNHYHQH